MVLLLWDNYVGFAFRRQCWTGGEETREYFDYLKIWGRKLDFEFQFPRHTYNSSHAGLRNEELFFLYFRNWVDFYGAVLDLCWDESQWLPVLSMANLKGLWVTIKVLADTSLWVLRALWPQLPVLQRGNSSGAALGTTNIQSLVPLSRVLVHPHMTMSSQKSRLHRVSVWGGL